MAGFFGNKSATPKATDPDSAIYLGQYFDLSKRSPGTELTYGGDRHLLLFGPTGSGKTTRLLDCNLLRLKNRSIVVIDPKGELTAITAPWRRKVGEVVVLNPFDVLGLGGAGFNPLAALDPEASTFVDDAAGIAEALVKIDPGERDPHWSDSARSLVMALVMWETKLAREEKRAPLLENVRRMLTEADEYDGSGQGILVKGLRKTASRMVALGGFEIGSLMGRFVRDTKEIASIQSAADQHTSWMLSPMMRAAMAKNDIDFAALKQRPITVYLILPAERMRTHSVWLRLVIVSALRALYKPGGVKTLFMLDEFAQLGHLAPIEDAFALVRGFGVQLWPVLQDLNQLKAIYKERWETFAGNAGVVQGFAPNDLTTAEWMSRRAGDTTVAAAGYNTGDSQSYAGQGSTSTGLSYNQARRSLFLPQELMGFPGGSGLLWPAGTAKSVPFTAPPYWKIPELKQRASPNPYYETSATKPAHAAPVNAGETNSSLQDGAATPRGVTVKGTIAAFDATTFRGTINGHDGRRYDLVMQEWREKGQPKAGLKIEFRTDGDTARDVHFNDRVTDLLAQYPGPVNLYPSPLGRGSMILNIVGGIFLMLLVLGYTKSGNVSESLTNAGYVGAMFLFLAMSAGAVMAIFPRLARLTLNAEGYEEKNLFERKTGKWDASLLADSSRKISKFSKSTFHTGGLSRTDLARLMTRWCERAIAEGRKDGGAQ